MFRGADNRKLEFTVRSERVFRPSKTTGMRGGAGGDWPGPPPPPLRFAHPASFTPPVVEDHGQERGGGDHPLEAPPPPLHFSPQPAFRPPVAAH